MWYSSEEPSKSIPHQAPSLNHSLLWVFAALGPVGQLICGLRGLCRRKRTPVSITSTPTTCIVRIRSLRPRDAPAITYRSRPVSTFRRARALRDWTTDTPSLAPFIGGYVKMAILADTERPRQVPLQWRGRHPAPSLSTSPVLSTASCCCGRSLSSTRPHRWSCWFSCYPGCG